MHCIKRAHFPESLFFFLFNHLDVMSTSHQAIDISAPAAATEDDPDERTALLTASNVKGCKGRRNCKRIIC